MSEQLLNIQFTSAQRKVIDEILPEFTDRLKLDEKDSRTLLFSLRELQTIQQNSRGAFNHANNGLIRNSLRHVVDAISNTIENSKGIGAIPASARLYQFKIMLIEIQPSIWRRIQIKNCSLDKFHERIQLAMGWSNMHHYLFKINGENYGDPRWLDFGADDFYFIDSTITKLSDIVPRDGKRFNFMYQYDFGDDWEHEVFFEGCLKTEPGQQYPLCLEGERKCPPEDAGGVPGYSEYIEVLADPGDDQHEEFLRWRGPFNS